MAPRRTYRAACDKDMTSTHHPGIPHRAQAFPLCHVFTLPSSAWQAAAGMAVVQWPNISPTRQQRRLSLSTVLCLVAACRTRSSNTPYGQPAGPRRAAGIGFRRGTSAKERHPCSHAAPFETKICQLFCRELTAFRSNRRTLHVFGRKLLGFSGILLAA